MSNYKSERDRENGRKNMASWRSRGDNRQYERERRRKWRAQNPGKDTEYQRLARLRNPGRSRKYHAAHRERLWQEAISAYGNHCVCCGESERAFLTFDHIDGGGLKQRKAMRHKSSMLYALRKLGFPKTLQMLCWNCNAAKHYSGACPHQATVLRLVK